MLMAHASSGQAYGQVPGIPVDAHKYVTSAKRLLVRSSSALQSPSLRPRHLPRRVSRGRARLAATPCARARGSATIAGPGSSSLVLNVGMFYDLAPTSATTVARTWGSRRGDRLSCWGTGDVIAKLARGT